ncbi:hypothetical protein [Aquisalibacillus elongatus]|uniref:Uncharacterized protein n=1 Tax=Aquisalibacillus elongatus TaxID=485577 RepID=A0A3N5B791_9BACI|nr:hypothetical protein [Aquisalibacillus elongatus]RPF53167.1 hypothetical protein EDC24_1663 [Aquisalibacillus elongatus]
MGENFINDRIAIFFGTFSWFIMAIMMFGFMTEQPSYIESLGALVLASLYVNTYILWLSKFCSWEEKTHRNIQLTAFLLLAIAHFIIWSIA